MINMASAIELMKLLLGSRACCLFCGADLVVNNGKCDACGAPLDPNVILNYARLKLSSDKLEGYTAANVMDLFEELTYRSSLALEYLRSRILDTLRKRSEKAEREGDIARVAYEREKEVLESLLRTLDLQREAINVGTIDAIERAYNELANVLKLHGNEISPEVLGLYTLPEFALSVADRYYKANRHREAIRWYGQAIIATIYPESSPKGLPKRFSAIFVPYGAANIGVFDGDFDGKPEIFYVPSSETAIPESPCIVINEGGVSWEPFGGYEAVFPVYGDMGDLQLVIFAWQSRRFPDAKLIGMGKEIKIIKDEETLYSIPVHVIFHSDVDGDENIELLIATGGGRIMILDSKGTMFDAKVIQTGNISSITSVRLKDTLKIVAATVDGRLILVDPLKGISSLIDAGFKEPCSAIVSSGDLDSDGFDEIYLSTRDGGYRYIMKGEKYSGSKIIDGDVLGMQVLDLNGDGKRELVVIKKDEGLLLEVHALRAALGVETIERIASYPIVAPRGIERACINYNVPFSSKPAFICEDVDLDQAPELLVGLNKALLIIDPKYA